MAYSEKLIDHFEHPRNVGTLDKNAQDVGTGMVGAPACGDVMRLQIKVNPEGVIEDAKFKTYGCGSAIASSSLVSEWVKGKTLEEAGKTVVIKYGGSAMVDEQLRAATGETVQPYITTGVNGRVKIVYAQKDDDVSACMMELSRCSRLTGTWPWISTPALSPRATRSA